MKCHAIYGWVVWHIKEQRMNLRLLTIFGLLISTSLIGQEYKNIDFSLILADCYKNDTISISINDIKIIKSEIVNSDFSTGLTDLSIFQNKKNLVINSSIGESSKDKILIDKRIDVHLTVGKIEYSKTFNLRKGKIIVIDYCNRQNDKGKIIKTIDFQQYKKTVEFDWKEKIRHTIKNIVHLAVSAKYEGNSNNEI